MKCHTNVNSTPPTQLPHKFLYIVAMLIHNHFESPNMYLIGVIPGEQQLLFELAMHSDDFW
jgi:hypothetical protein